MNGRPGRGRYGLVWAGRARGMAWCGPVGLGVARGVAWCGLVWLCGCGAPASTDDAARWAGVIRPSLASAEDRELEASDAYEAFATPAKRRCLVVWVRYENVSRDRRPFYTNVAGARLEDGAGNRLADLVAKAPGLDVGQRRNLPLGPGESVAEPYVFEFPPARSGPVHLAIPLGAMFHRGPDEGLRDTHEEVTLAVPADAIRRP